MSRPTAENIQRLQTFIDSLPEESKSKCATCTTTLTHIVKQGEVETGCGTATVTKALAEKINATAAPADKVSAGSFRDKVRRNEGKKESGRNAQIKSETVKRNPITPCIEPDEQNEKVVELERQLADLRQQLEVTQNDLHQALADLEVANVERSKLEEELQGYRPSKIRGANITDDEHAEMVRLKKEGLSNKAIAERIGRTPAAVGVHLKSASECGEL